MPDLERVSDEIRLELANTPEDRARAEGFIAGKAFARKEMLLVAVFIAATVLIIWILVSAT